MGVYDKRYRFRVEFDGMTLAAFRTCGPLEATTESVEEHEGGAQAPTKEPGKLSFANVVLTKGKTDNTELYDWWKKVNIDGEDDKRNGSIVQTDRAGNEIRRYNLFGAWPARYKWGEWDATASENNIEELELSIDSAENA